jgi:hypothetical protein
MDYASEYADAIKELSKGIQSGAIKTKFHIVEGGIEQAPVALPMLFSGGNTGKLYVVRVLFLWFTHSLFQGCAHLRRTQAGAVQTVICTFCLLSNIEKTVSIHIYML